MSAGFILAASLLLGGGITLLILNNWEDIAANPGVALETAARKIEQNPTRVINILRAGAAKLLTDPGRYMTFTITKELIKDVLGIPVGDWAVSSTMTADESDTTQPNSNRKAVSMMFSKMLTSLADNLSSGGVASVVSALRSASRRTIAAGTELQMNNYWQIPASDRILLDPSRDIYFSDILYDLFITVTPSLNSTYWVDPRPGRTIVPQYNQSTVAEKQIISSIIPHNMKWNDVYVCQQQWGSFNPALIYPTCSDSAGDTRKLSELLATISTIESAAAPLPGTSLRMKQTLSNDIMAYKNRIENYLQSNIISDKDLVELLLDMLDMLDEHFTHSDLDENNQILDELGI
jgi:hypothetical protein